MTDRRLVAITRGLAVTLCTLGCLAIGPTEPAAASQYNAYGLQCTSNLRGIQSMFFMYAQNHKWKFPWSPEGSIGTLRSLLSEESFDPKALVCPLLGAGSSKEDDIAEHETCSYEYVTPPKKWVPRSRWILAYCRHEHRHQLRMACEISGRVSELTAEELRERLKMQRAPHRHIAVPPPKPSSSGKFIALVSLSLVAGIWFFVRWNARGSKPNPSDEQEPL